MISKIEKVKTILSQDGERTLNIYSFVDAEGNIKQTEIECGRATQIIDCLGEALLKESFLTNK